MKTNRVTMFETKRVTVLASAVLVLIAVAMVLFVAARHMPIVKAEDPIIGRWDFRVLLGENETTGKQDEPDYYPDQFYEFKEDGTVHLELLYLGTHKNRYNDGTWVKTEDNHYQVTMNHPWGTTDVEEAVIQSDGSMQIVSRYEEGDDQWLRFTFVYDKK